MYTRESRELRTRLEGDLRLRERQKPGDIRDVKASEQSLHLVTLGSVVWAAAEAEWQLGSTHVGIHTLCHVLPHAPFLLFSRSKTQPREAHQQVSPAATGTIPRTDSRKDEVLPHLLAAQLRRAEHNPGLTPTGGESGPTPSASPAESSLQI